MFALTLSRNLINWETLKPNIKHASSYFYKLIIIAIHHHNFTVLMCVYLCVSVYVNMITQERFDLGSWKLNIA